MPHASPALWRHAGFRTLYLSTLWHALAIQVYQLAMPLILYELTRSAMTMSTMRAVELLPNLALAMFIGVLVDRIDRGRWARHAMCGMFLLMFAQSMMIDRPSNTALVSIYTSAFALMTLSYVYGICRMGMLKEMLPSPSLLPATAYLTAMEQVTAVLGPVIAGLLLEWDLRMGLWFSMAGLALAAWWLREADLPPRPRSTTGFWQAWREGWRHFLGNRPLWQLSWLVAIANGSSGVVAVLVLFRARDELHIEPAALGLVYGLAGAGGVIGGLLANRLRGRTGIGRLFTLALLTDALCMASLAWIETPMPLALALFASAFASVVGNICAWGFRHESTPGAFIGRVSGITGSLFKLLMPVALLLSGSLTGAWPVACLLAACAAVHLLAAACARGSAFYHIR